MGLTGIWREKPCKKNDKKRQKSEVETSSNRRERENLGNFWKSQNPFLKNLIHDIRLIEKQFWSIKTDRGSPKFLKEILIDRKTVCFNRKSGKISF